jgi:hypothetical protein
MIGIKFVLQHKTTKVKQESTELFFPEWDEKVESLVHINRERFERSMPDYRVLTVIANEENT